MFGDLCLQIIVKNIKLFLMHVNFLNYRMLTNFSKPNARVKTACKNPLTEQNYRWADLGMVKEMHLPENDQMQLCNYCVI